MTAAHRPLRPCGVCMTPVPNGDCPTHPKRGGYRPERESVRTGAYGRYWQRVRDAAVRAAGEVCQYCDGPNGVTGDHVVPRSRGGQTIIENVVAACSRCNTAKGSRTLREWVRTGGAPMPAVRLLARRMIDQLPI